MTDIEFFQKMVWLIVFGHNCSGDNRGINIRKISESTKEYRNPLILNLEILLGVAQKYIIHSIF